MNKKQKMLNQLLIATCAVLIVWVAILTWITFSFQNSNQSVDQSLSEQLFNKSIINSYEACAAAGYPIQETYPERCVVPGGNAFTRPIE